MLRYKQAVSTLRASENGDVLQQACTLLGLVEGCLRPATSSPEKGNKADWLDKGDWLKLAHSLNADSVFFVNNEPVVVLAYLPDGEDEARFFNRIWCMARPQILFLARAGELAVYQLAAPPVTRHENLRESTRLLGMAKTADEILQNLAKFRRENIESGEVFGDERFGTSQFRADHALLHDLKEVLRQLTTGPDKLSPQVAHALIARSLFIRYLEDRDVLVPDYFYSIVTPSKKQWQTLLDTPPSEIFAEPELADVLFFRVLNDVAFTYGLFNKLAVDFNGDTFPVTEQEKSEVKQHHLSLLRDLLAGNGDGQLFLFAYRFHIVPIELISSIYEEFYNTKRDGKGGESSYYTSPSLVEFLLSQVLTDSALATRPVVTDPACGSGIFLVEAFRRMVRQRIVSQQRRLSQRELRGILRNQIRGIDLNPEAIPVAAFSLYLAYLHYQEPREINESRHLPNLRWLPNRENRDAENDLDILYSGNAFKAIDDQDAVASKRFGYGSCNVLVGNPPWGEVKKEDILGFGAFADTKDWLAKRPERIIGDNEQSQAFVHLAMELLEDGGTAAMLLSSGVLYKQHKHSRAFRQSWLRRCRLSHVVNFSHVRHLFFKDPKRTRRQELPSRQNEATSPFISAVFKKAKPSIDHRFVYWAARRTADVENTRAVVIAHSDMHRLRQDDCRAWDKLWKIYWWGGRRDEGLVRELERFPSLEEIALSACPEVPPAQGFTPGSMRDAPHWFSELQLLDAVRVMSYGPVSNSWILPLPNKVHRPGKEQLFSGPRLLILRGVGEQDQPITARFEIGKYLVSNAANIFRLDGLSEAERLVVLGICWSSLAEYYWWLTASSWGMWHDEIQKHAAASLPIALPKTDRLRNIIVGIVEQLRNGIGNVKQLEKDLDEAIFDLYELNEADRDLVRDMCLYGLDFFFKKSKSIAVQPVKPPTPIHGLAQDLPKRATEGLAGYLQVFLKQWNSDLVPDGELAWDVIFGSGNSSVLAVLFSTVPKGQREDLREGISNQEWSSVLSRIQNNALVPLEKRRKLYSDTFIRVVSDHEILIIKRNEARHWTRSMARADADATVAQAMTLAGRQTHA